MRHFCYSILCTSFFHVFFVRKNIESNEKCEVFESKHDHLTDLFINILYLIEPFDNKLNLFYFVILEQLREQSFTIQKLIQEGEYASSHEQELTEKMRVCTFLFE